MAAMVALSSVGMLPPYIIRAYARIVDGGAVCCQSSGTLDSACVILLFRLAGLDGSW